MHGRSFAELQRVLGLVGVQRGSLGPFSPHRCRQHLHHYPGGLSGVRKPDKSKWVKYVSLEKLVVCNIRETSREHWNFSSQEDTKLFRCETLLAETFFEIIEGLQRLRLINRNMDNISLCAYSELILKWTPQQIKEESCFKLAVAEARALPG